MENYIMLNGKRIDLTAEQIETLVGKKEKDPFERAEGGKYSYIDSDGEVESDYDDGTLTDDAHYEAGNYCTDGELLKQRALHVILNQLLWRYSMQNNGGEIEPRFYIYRCDDGRYQIGCHPHCRVYGVTYFDVVATANDAVEEIVIPFMEKHPEFRW